MNKIRIIGIAVLLCGIAISLIFANKVSDISGAVLIGLGIGVALTGGFGRKI
ncbi:MULTISPECIES: hypothetical protein [Antarcticibacterium]|uniref:hypothetical protein n=1 Tax=Antarcticibacterium TaxID=2058174 RepID=UPI00143D32B6|nr:MULTISPECIES: hypothetical protein [Antarcticibacterium]